ncbi:MAG: 2-dehydropantoate 2-reductase [Chloroflexi bacterium RBG_16_54_18]|nr:MAG: 2-dehydropantoate 2-reductase [Chloroflexi bacterium RBG_16_54_18]
MRIGIFGSGGVGGYFGGRLAQAGEEVVFIARGDHLQALQASGLRIESFKGDLHLPAVQATSDPAQAGPVDMVLLAVKSWHLAGAIQAMRPMIGEQTGVLSLGNGVEAPGLLVDTYGTQHAMAGLCLISSFLVGPGHIKHVGIDPVVAIGELDNRRSARVETLRAAFERAGVNISIPADILAAMWEKFIFIAAMSGVGSITRSPAGVFRSLPGARRILEGVIAEIVQVGRKRGVNLPVDVAAKTLAIADSLPHENQASMVRDILGGKPSELEAQNGAVVRMGAEAGFDTPFNQFIYDCLLPQELKARGDF